MAQSKPSITGTAHTLPFDKLSPRDFERLCLWLVESEGYEHAEHLGAAGSERGRDVIALREGKLWAFQCKRVRRFGPQDALDEVKEVLALPQDQRPGGLVFIVTCDVSANTRQQVRARCAGKMECRFWVSTELDRKVKRHPDIVGQFFRAAPPDVVIYEGTKPVSAADLLNACQAQVEGVLYDVRQYDPKLYVNRAIEPELNEFLDTSVDGPAPNCFLIVAPAGSGKTNLLCELARVRATQQPELLLMGGNIYIGATTGLLGGIQSELQAANRKIQFRSAEDSLHTLDCLAEELDRDALLILDAINEHDRPAQMRKALEDLLRKTRGKRIKLVITCRDYYWGLFKGRFWEGATINALPAEDDEDEESDAERDFSRFAVDEHELALDLYLEHYGITGRPVGDAVEQCRHPLLLRFFCEAYRGKDVTGIEDIRLKELFDHYWHEKLGSIAERMLEPGSERLLDGLANEVGGYLLNVAAHMLHNNMRAVPLNEMSRAMQRTERYDDPRSVYGRIRDEFIILEEKKREKRRRKEFQVAFVYEKFMEYVMARSLMRDWDQANLDEASILAEVEALTDKYKSFAQIMGVMVYLALMLREERDLALWSLLMNRGEHWQRVVCEAFRKLPEEQLDAGVFDVLREMLTTSDEKIQMLALDTLKVKRVGKAATVPVVSAVCELVTHPQEPIRRRAVLALGNTVETDLAMTALTEAVRDPKRSVRKNAVTALIGLGDARAGDLFVSALEDSRYEVRFEMAEALGVLAAQIDDAALLTPAVEALIPDLKDSDAEVQMEAAMKLGELAAQIDDGALRARAVESLIANLDEWEWAAEGAAQALGRLGDPRAVKPLIDVLRDSERDRDLRQSAAQALGKLGEAAVEPLIAALEHKNREVRWRATEALGELGAQLDDAALLAQAVRALTVALQDRSKVVQGKAAQALHRIGTPETLAAVGEYEHRKRAERELQ